MPIVVVVTIVYPYSFTDRSCFAKQKTTKDVLPVANCPETWTAWQE